MSFELPPHIIKTSKGEYVSTRTNRYISESKIQIICDKYWGNEVTIKHEAPKERKLIPVENKNLDKPKKLNIAYVKRKDGDLQAMSINKINPHGKIHLLLFDGRRIYRFVFRKSKSFNLAFDLANKGISMEGRIGTKVPNEFCRIHFNNL